MALQLEELRSCPTPGDVHETLQTLPESLKETYDKILDSVPKRHQSYIRAALQWIACSARPLSLDELAIAVVNDPAVVNLHGSENRLVGGGEAIQKMLSKLIEVHSSSGFLHPRPRSGSLDYLLTRLREWVDCPRHNIVVFSHSSVRDYLIQRHDHTDVSRSFSFSEDMAHRFIAKSLLAFIENMPETVSVGDKADGKGEPDLQMYLARHWHTHAVHLPDEEPGSLAHMWNEVPLAVRFIMMGTDEYTKTPFAEFLFMEEFQTEPPSPEKQLQYAACRGSRCILDIILASNPNLDVDASTELGETALSFACERQYWQIANTLLKRGADPNKHGDSAAPLLDASRDGADDMVRKLISHSADVNVLCDTEDENTPLTAAIAANHLSTVELLLISGANPDTPSVSVAAREGRLECMDLLLKHGASLEGPDMFASPLELASEFGSVEMVKFLLTHGLSVNEKNCLMPLSEDEMVPANTYNFDYPNVKIYMPLQKFPRWWSLSYGSPMHAAAANGHTEVVKLLVENNAAVNERSAYWETPSTLVKLRDHHATLEYLVSKGGVALEQTEVCYRQDIFKGSSGEERLRFCGPKRRRRRQ